eukprot:4520013-Karenia_brevis.AAC.1
MEDRIMYDEVFDCCPYLLCSPWWSPVTRPRLWWTSATPIFPPKTVLATNDAGVTHVMPVA